MAFAVRMNNAGAYPSSLMGESSCETAAFLSTSSYVLVKMLSVVRVETFLA
jgi:hypothetical protein